MQAIYGLNPGEIFWAASDLGLKSRIITHLLKKNIKILFILGWVVGHSYICYGPLLARNTTVLYEGKPVGTPDAGAIFRVISEHKVACTFIGMLFK